MTTKATHGGKASGHSTKSNETQHGNPDPAAVCHAGLDTTGEFRFGANFTVAVRGGDLVLRQANSGREKVLSEAEFEGLIKETYFMD